MSTAVKPHDAVRPVGVSGRLSRARQYVKREHVALAGVVFVGVALRLWYAEGNYSIVFPDEFHQSTEQAHRLVYGYGLIPWEFDSGARSWAWPVLLAGPLELAKLLGLSAPSEYTEVLRGVLVVASACVIPAVYLLARVFGAQRVPAVAGAALSAFAAPFVYFSHRAFSEAASLLPVTLGFAFAVGAVDRWRDHTRARQLLWAGALLLGFSVHLRLQNALFCIGLLFVLAWRKEWRATYHALLAFGISLLALAMTDLATWGAPLSSAREYVEYQLAHGAANSWGALRLEEFPRKLWNVTPWVVTCFVVAAALGRLSHAPSLFVVTAGSWLFYTLVGYWEPRYVLPVLPFACALAAVELSALAARFKPRVGIALAAALAALAFVYGLQAPDQPEYYADVNSLMMVAGREPDICGLFVEPADLAWTGGYYLFHRRVPLYGGEDNAPGSPRYYNYAIRDTGSGGATLTKTRDSCEPDPNFSYTLDEPP